MDGKTPLNYRVRYVSPAGHERDSRVVLFMTLLLLLISALIVLVASGPAQTQQTVIGNFIAIGGRAGSGEAVPRYENASNKQLYKRGFPLECRRPQGSGEVVVWIKDGVAKVMVSREDGSPLLYVVTRGFVYSYDILEDKWYSHPPSYPMAVGDMDVGNLTAIDFITSTLNLYDCRLSDFNNELLVFSNVP